MKISCLTTVLTICLLVLGLLFTPHKAVKKYTSYCQGMPSRITLGGSAQVVNIEKGHYLPLYSEAYASGGTNGGLTGGTVVKVVGGPYCSQGLTWWEVTGRDAYGYDNSGYVHEMNEGQRFLEPIG